MPAPETASDYYEVLYQTRHALGSSVMILTQLPLTAAAFPTSPSHSSDPCPSRRAVAGHLLWVQVRMECGRVLTRRCFLRWDDSADLQSYVSSRLYCAVQDMNYILFLSSAEFINCS